ncbi:Uncharacterised protein [uncultured archaeon]|nr:Uncharacterised protein [uncultured archaeon]
MDIAGWEVIFFESSRGEKPVEEFFEKQQLSARTKMLHLFELLELYGSRLGMPHAKQLGTGIYELRVRGKEEIRVFYGFKQKNIYLLHAFKKQTQKTPQKELEIAIKRLTEI